MDVTIPWWAYFAAGFRRGIYCTRAGTLSLAPMFKSINTFIEAGCLSGSTDDTGMPCHSEYAAQVPCDGCLITQGNLGRVRRWRFAYRPGLTHASPHASSPQSRWNIHSMEIRNRGETLAGFISRTAEKSAPLVT